ncbi:hypothetical protein EV702DRAFT_1199664 [Suillus placidus]|uniref:Uncharacterized protein n=1 Tax=Suillus placidus TaxID=48579 RepID=A0A9P7D104_9AGAM|nr:hypothetical protein EV702DRAFT_1199664 [Suillus placidus]
MDVDLTPEQEAILQEVRESQLQTWFYWHANSSKKNRSLKKKLTVFENALQQKRRAKSDAKIYSEMFYNECIKPLVMAEAEASNVTTSGKCVALDQKFSKELLDNESEDVKVEEDDSGKTGDPDEEESKEHKDSSNAEGDDGDEASEEDEADGQSGDMEEDKGEGNKSVGAVKSAVLPIFGASSSHASGIADTSIITTNASSGPTESLSAGELIPQHDAAYYGMQALYDSQAQTIYRTQAHTMYGALAHPMYSIQGPTYDTQGTSHASFGGMYPSFLTGSDASLPSQGSTFLMQTSTYTDFGIHPSNLFTPSIATPESSLNEGF